MSNPYDMGLSLPGRPGEPSDADHVCVFDICRTLCDHCGDELCLFAQDFDDPQLVLKVAQAQATYLALCSPCHAVMCAASEDNDHGNL